MKSPRISDEEIAKKRAEVRDQIMGLFNDAAERLKSEAAARYGVQPKRVPPKRERINFRKVAYDLVHSPNGVEGMLSGAAYVGELNVRCPMCGGQYSHISEVFTRIGSDPCDEPGGADAYPGTMVHGTTAERRRALVIVFDGECPHRWELIIQQHKGINMLTSAAVERTEVVHA